MKQFSQRNLRNNLKNSGRKISQYIILIEPHNLKHLRNILKGEQRTQLGPFVLRFKLKENKVYFITFRHHDKAY